MLEPNIPKDEDIRLSELLSYRCLDTSEESRYDELTQLAAQICEMPIALISLVDKERQWFKSHYGLEAKETPRNISFCGHAILSDEPFVVENAKEDPRFADNPLVTGAPHVVFYVGIPLKNTRGINLGTLCVIDHKPRQLNSEFIKRLEIIARQVVNLLELDKKQTTLNLLNEDLREFSDIFCHEIKAPLRHINFLTENFIEEHHLDEKAGDYTVRIDERINRANVLLDDLSRYVGINFADRASRNVDLNIVINDIQKSIDHQKEFTLHIREKLPTIRTNEFYLEQVFMNLIDNAVKYNDKNKAEVSIFYREDGNFYEFTIKDNGPGIADVDADKIFNAFYTTDKKSAFNGCGVGLAIVKKILLSLGSDIFFESSTTGTSFVFTWPRI